MARSTAAGEAAPMGEMNTTPLIDVMLVLLIMFIITIPMQTHAIKVDLSAAPEPPEDLILEPVRNLLAISDRSELTWNGHPVTLLELRNILDQTRQMRPEPELQFRPDPSADYLTVDRTLAVIKRSDVSRFGFVGNESYASFGKAEVPPQ